MLYTSKHKGSVIDNAVDKMIALIVDSSLSTTSANPVQNKAIALELNTKLSNKTGIWQNDQNSLPRIYFGDASVTDDVIFRAAKDTTSYFELRKADNTVKFRVDMSTGAMSVGSIPWSLLSSVPSTFPPATHNHGSFDRLTSPLTGASVFSDLVVSKGILTGVTTRALTFSDVGAQAESTHHTVGDYQIPGESTILYRIQKNSGTDAFTVFEIASPPNSDGHNAEATLALMRPNDSLSGGPEFLDLYNNGYEDSRQMGIRIQSRGTGQLRDFVFDFNNGSTGIQEVLRIRTTGISAKKNIGIINDSAGLELYDSDYTPTALVMHSSSKFDIKNLISGSSIEFHDSGYNQMYFPQGMYIYIDEGKIFLNDVDIREATTATKLATTRAFTIGSTAKNFDGSSDVSWTLSEIGAAPATHTHTPAEVGALASDAKAADSDKLDGYHATDFAGSVHNHGRLSINDVRDTNPTPDEILERTITTFFTNMYGDDWRSGITVKGWDDGYQAWQLTAPSSVSTNESLKFRTGINSSWNPWRVLLHSGNFINYVYPVGSIYMSYSSTSPATLFGGTWSALPTGKFLRTGTGGSTGGSDTHAHTTAAMALSESQMPSHIHNIIVNGWYVVTYGVAAGASGGSGVALAGVSSVGQAPGFGNSPSYPYAYYVGGGAAHGHGNTGSASNVPAYYEVYAWRRTA